MKDIRQNILATLAYYDVFDLPLTTEDVFNYLSNSSNARVKDLPHPKIGEIQKELDQLILGGTINGREGYYFLFDREYLVPLAIKNRLLSKRKWKIAKRAIWRLRFLPYVRAVFASGSLAMNNTNELSDLDVLIVLKNGRIWLGRLLILGLLTLLRVRRKGSDLIAPNKVCASHFLTDNSLSANLSDIYNARTLSNLVPIYSDDASLIEKFKSENAWVLDYLCFWNIKETPIFSKSWAKIFSKTVEFVLGGKIGNWLENLARSYQSNRIVQNPVTARAGDRIIFNDRQLLFRINSAIIKSRPISLETQTLKNYNERLSKMNL